MSLVPNLARGKAGRRQHGHDGTPLLKVSDLSLRFGALEALSKVSLEMAEGTWLGVIGPNGSGKSSLLNCIAGQYQASRGSVIYRGLDVTRTTPSASERAGIARIFQNLSLAPSMSLVENIHLGLEGRTRRRDTSRSLTFEVLEEIQRWGLEPYAKHFPSDAPYGVRKASETVRAILSEPSLLLLDEPAAGLSSEERKMMILRFEELRERRKDLGVLLVEHDVGFVRTLCQHLVALDAGNVIAQGPTSEVLANRGVVEAFLGKGV